MIIPYLSLGDHRYLDSAGEVHQTTGTDPLVEVEAVKLDEIRANKDLYEAERANWAEVAKLGGHDLDELLGTTADD